jgi:hypothetical protein
MKKKYLKLFILLFLLLSGSFVFGQYGSFKYCPNTPAWNANRKMVEDTKGMYVEYAKGPDGCWWLKSAKHASYVEGYYQFNIKGLKYYYNKKKKYWEDGNRKACVEQPFGK